MIARKVAIADTWRMAISMAGRGVGTALLLLGWVFLFSSASAYEPVTAELREDAAWTGQPVRISVTLYSPGPFTGTAKFDLPELPQTLILRGERPVVGSESIDGITLLTQQHELTLFTQRSGTIEIPAFKVQFSGKENFTSDPIPMSGTTSVLTFESKRPPGTQGQGFVLAAADLKATQTWRPEVIDSIVAGDVIERTIQQQATGTTAMMIAAINSSAAAGVSVYNLAPIVEDRSVRGDSTATRIETIKYQFQQPGTFLIPDVEVVWWDTQAEQIRVQRLEGRRIDVGSAPLSAEHLAGTHTNHVTFPWLGMVAGLIVSAALLVGLILRDGSRTASPESLAAKRFSQACRKNDPLAAYQAWLAWKRIVLAGKDTETSAAISSQAGSLERLLFGSSTTSAAWLGAAFLREFQEFRRQMLGRRSARARAKVLPELNCRA